jgi:predicted negative regulator of RcsB-dependent stress response
MKNLKEQNPIVLAFAIIGIGALLYGGWTLYQQHLIQQQDSAFRYGPPIPGVAGLNQPSKQPPPQ